MTPPRLPPGRITPSKPDYWMGSRPEGATFTTEQVEAMQRCRIDPARTPTHSVRLTAPRPSFFAPPAEGFEVACPIVNQRRDRTAIAIITPSGHTLWLEVPPPAPRPIRRP